MGELAPYILGGLGGGGVLLAYYGLKALRAGEERGPRRRGLIMVNAGVALVMVTLALMIWGQ